MLEDIWDKIWRDEDGHVVIFQMPNAWLIAWAVLTMLSLFTGKLVSDVFSWASIGALIIWCLLEIFDGVNYFRRGLGTVVLVFAILMIFKSI